MDDILVGRLMSTDLITVTPDALVENAATTMLDNGVGSLIVVDDDNRLEGILTSTDFIDIVSKSKPKAETTVERYMTRDVVTVSAQDTAVEVSETMLDGGFHHVPVVDDVEGVIGLISTTDLTAYVSQIGSMEA